MTVDRHGPPLVSIVIPSHNRAPRLRRTLLILAPQISDRSGVEIVVCADGCQDDTAAMARSLTDLPLSVIETPGLGPAGARNAGVDAARGSLLIFLDDDVEPGASFLAEHIKAHEEHPGAVVLGPYPPLPIASRSGFRLATRQWWTRHFESLAARGHRMSYRDVLTGNLSLNAATWQLIGKFDPALRAHEDYEFGIRAIQAGVPVVYRSGAHGYHYEHETMQLDRSFNRIRDEARADVAIARLHPEIGYEFKLGRWRRYLQLGTNEAVRAMFAAGGRGDKLAQKAAGLLHSLDKHGLRGRHIALYGQLMSYWYMRELSDCFGSFAEWRAFATSFPKPRLEPPLPIDLRKGIEAAEEVLDRTRPQHARLIYAGEPVGELPYAAGTEPWAARHLRPLLARGLAPAYLRVLAADGLIADSGPGGRRRMVKAITRMTRHYPIRHSPRVWEEQAEQWKAVPLSAGNPMLPAKAATSSKE
jgi:GT2 family glycosyltransferase